MKNSCLRVSLAVLLFTVCSRALADEPSVASDERVLFGKSAYLQLSGQKGAEAKIDPESRFLQVKLPTADSGASVRCVLGGTRLDPMPYLTDPAPVLDVLFRPMAGQSLPTDIYLVLEVIDFSTKPAVRKLVRTPAVPTASASTAEGGWKFLRVPFEKFNVVNGKDAPDQDWTRRIRLADGKTPDITAKDVIERVQIWGSSPGAIEVNQISLVRLRNVSVNVKNDLSRDPSKLEIEGETNTPSGEVMLKLVDAAGQAHVQTVQAKAGKYQFTWENPPLTTGKDNTLQASLGDGKNPLDQAIAKDVFGFLKNTEHVWLDVKGRDIVTSPASSGGSQPFYAVGTGYGKNVLVRGYDEEVAAYSKKMFLNTLRLAFYTTNFNNKAEMPLTFEDITAFIDPVIAAAKRQGLYVILDDHSYFKSEINEETARGEQKSSGWTEERFENWVKRWVQVATYYKNEPYVLGYELCNEPVCDAETARKWYKRCIDAIRQVDQRHIVLVGTHNWSHSRAMEATWSGVADKIDAPYNKAVFSFHDYPQDDDPWKVQAHLREFQAKYHVPVMCTEFGAGGRPERVHREFQTGMLAMFAFDRVGWMIWSLYYDMEKSSGYPTVAVQNKGDKTWDLKMEYPGYWIPFVELWAPTARIMGSPFPEPASK